MNSLLSDGLDGLQNGFADQCVKCASITGEEVPVYKAWLEDTVLLEEEHALAPNSFQMICQLYIWVWFQQNVQLDIFVNYIY